MADLLLRDIDDQTKQWLVGKAREHGRSQSAEACAVLDAAAMADRARETNPFIKFYRACQESEAAELVVPERHPARKPDVWWLKEGALDDEELIAGGKADIA